MKFLFLLAGSPNFSSCEGTAPAGTRSGEEDFMGSVSIWHWIVVGIIVMLLFGRGKVSELMGDVAKGIKSFKKGMADDEPVASSSPAGDASKPVADQRDAAPTQNTSEHKAG